MLLLINSTISFIEENNAGNAAAALMAHLAPKAKVIIHLFSVFFICRLCYVNLETGTHFVYRSIGAT
jgi:hypothetical protein